MSLSDAFDRHAVSTLADVDRSKVLALFVFLAPGLTLFTIFSVAPMAYSLVGSFFEWDAFTMTHFVGLQTWRAALTDPLIINWQGVLALEFPMGALPQNLLWMVIHVPVSTLLGLGLALLFADLKGRRVLRSMVFVGFTTPTVVVGLVLLFIYDPQAGVVNAVLRSLGLSAFVQNWLKQPQVAIYALIAGGIWIQTGFSMLLYSSALSNLDPALLESARIDGAGPYRRFRDIIWPTVRPVTAVVVIMAVIWVLRLFGIVYAAGGPSGGPFHAYSVLGLEVFRAAFRVPIQYGRAMVIAMIELLIALPLAVYIARMN
ncbi:MAG: carbohydrate ABC transporter permease [Halanaeroarchaeum sp.]